MFYSDDIKEQIREKIDIVDLVGKYLPLHRQGRGFVARCPWHDDRKPSLQVNPERQLFKCWVCDIGGDIFSFVMKMEGCEFQDAVRILADMANIELPQSPQRSSGRFRHRQYDPSEAPEEADAYEPSPEELNGQLLSAKPTSSGDGSSNTQNISPETEPVIPSEDAQNKNNERQATNNENTQSASQNPLVTPAPQPATNKSTPRQTLSDNTRYNSLADGFLVSRRQINQIFSLKIFCLAQTSQNTQKRIALLPLTHPDGKHKPSVCVSA